jgi:DnaJ homolog subfamily C member 19
MIKFIVLAALLAVIYYYGRHLLMAQKPMSVVDAAKLLDVPATASAETIISAHKRLIAKVHPDAGGSADLAARVNLARDTMLRAITK